MDFKSLINKTKEKKQSFWALLLEPGWISAAIWEVIGDEINVVSSGPMSSWSGDDDFIEAVDTALSSCVTTLPEDYEEPEKTVFGLPSGWIVDGNIKDEYLTRLKKVCDELSLVPSGFVVLSEAIAHYVKVDEGSPLSAVVLGMSEHSLEITLFKLGKSMGTFDVSRSVSMVDDLVEGLTRFGTEEVFPSRIVIYDGKEADLESIRNSLSEANWEGIKKIKFLHLPRVNVIKSDDKLTAVCLAGGAEIAGATKIVGKKIDDSSVENDESVQNVEKPKEELTAQDLGFVVGTEGQQEIKPTPTTDKKPLLDLRNKLKFNFKSPAFKIPRNNKPFVIGTIFLLAIFVLGFVFWWFYPKASVTVYVSPKKLDEQMQVSLESDLPSKEVKVQVSGEKTTSTTGTKVVGDRAKGSVKIQNGTSNTINLVQGTVLVSSTDLKFNLEKSASVSAALSPSSPGVATVDIVAYDIGPEYNLAKDEVFKIGNYPKADMDAISVNDFSGGSSRQISAVSEEDIVGLEESLTSELVDQAKKDFQGKISFEELFIDSSLKVEVDSSDFSNKEGDEASTLKLSLGLAVSGKVVSRKDLASASSKILEGKIPTGFVLRDDQVVYKFSPSKDLKDTFDVDVTVNLLPNIDTVDVAKKVAGKYPDLAQGYLTSVPGFVRAEFRVKPLLPGKLGTLPHVFGRIDVEVSADR